MSLLRWYWKRQLHNQPTPEHVKCWDFGDYETYGPPLVRTSDHDRLWMSVIDKTATWRDIRRLVECNFTEAKMYEQIRMSRGNWVPLNG